jgi:hypothetical protein
MNLDRFADGAIEVDLKVLEIDVTGIEGIGLFGLVGGHGLVAWDLALGGG